jgi:hypothetical protein
MSLKYEPASEPLHIFMNRAQLNNLLPEQVMYLEQGGLTLPDTSAYLMESKAAQPRALAGTSERRGNSLPSYTKYTR